MADVERIGQRSIVAGVCEHKLTVNRRGEVRREGNKTVLTRLDLRSYQGQIDLRNIKAHNASHDNHTGWVHHINDVRSVSPFIITAIKVSGEQVGESNEFLPEAAQEEHIGHEVAVKVAVKVY
jgi:hypothetical protein